jgi:hypothetical protein
MKLRMSFPMAVVLAVGFAQMAQAAVPPGWIKAGNAPNDYEIAIDPSVSMAGKQSASIMAKAGSKADGFATLMQMIAADDYRGARLRLSGYLRTEAADRAQMWMRVDGPNAKAVAFDNLDSHPLTGTTAWTRYEIVLDVPPNGADIVFGFFLKGAGKVWGDGFRLERVGASVPVTTADPPLPRGPVNLDFADSGSRQMAVWVQRKLLFTGGGRDTQYTCEGFRDDMKSVLQQMGARMSDLDVREYACPARAGVNATFWTLVPLQGAAASGQTPVEAQWRNVEIHFDDNVAQLGGVAGQNGRCDLLKQIQQKIVPFFAVRNVEFSGGDCIRYQNHARLQLQVLKPSGAN